jgi:hypothetical protein
VTEETATAVLRRVAPAWAWVRHNFTLPAVLAIAALVVSSTSWMWAQHVSLTRLEAREDPKRQLERIEARLGQILQTQAAMGQQLADFGRRVDEQQRKWERVEEVAEIRIPARHPRR